MVTPYPLPPIIGICGDIEAGKDTAAQYLVSEHGYTRISWADKLKEVVADIYDFPLRWCYTPAGKRIVLNGLSQEVAGEVVQVPLVLGPDGKPTTVRKLLEVFGTEVGRCASPDTWVNAALRKAEREGLARLVIPDTRFPNEFEAARKCGGVVWEVVRHGGPPIERTGHDSDEAWRGLPKDAVLDNYWGQMQRLGQAVRDALHDWGLGFDHRAGPGHELE